MLTLTVALPATPTALYSYFERCWRKVKNHYPLAEYISVIEPHQSGRFHFHLLLKLKNSRMPTPSTDFISKCWTVGIVHVKQIYDVTGLAGYLTSKKKKLAWIQNHVPKAKLWHSSKGIVRPITKTMNRKKLKKYVKDSSFRFSGGDRVKVIYNNSTVANIITHERFVRG